MSTISMIVMVVALMAAFEWCFRYINRRFDIINADESADDTIIQSADYQI